MKKNRLKCLACFLAGTLFVVSGVQAMDFDRLMNGENEKFPMQGDGDDSGDDSIDFNLLVGDNTNLINVIDNRRYFFINPKKMKKQIQDQEKQIKQFKEKLQETELFINRANAFNNLSFEAKLSQLQTNAGKSIIYEENSKINLEKLVAYRNTLRTTIPILEGLVSGLKRKYREYYGTELNSVGKTDSVDFNTLMDNNDDKENEKENNDDVFPNPFGN